MAIDPKDLARWRLVLGKSAEEPLQELCGHAGQPILGGDQGDLDEALEAIYSGDEIEKNEWERPIDDLMTFFEAGNSQRRADNDALLARYSLAHRTVMKQHFDIELSVEPS